MSVSVNKYSNWYGATDKNRAPFIDYELSLNMWKNEEPNRKIEWISLHSDESTANGGRAVLLNLYIGDKLMNQCGGWGENERAARQNAAMKALSQQKTF